LADPVFQACPVLTLPNLLTASRLILAPFVAWRLALQDVEGAFGLFVIAALTDLLDGWLARLLNQKSDFGAWLDPIADKTMILTTLIFLALTELLPLWLLWLILLRDGIILAGALAYRRLTGGLKITPILSGKLTIALEFVLVSWVLAADSLFPGLIWGIAPLTLLTAAAAVLSCIRYVRIWSSKTRTYLRQRDAAS
jgi:cardiolipin synthase